jgi:hypothetical protein
MKKIIVIAVLVCSFIPAAFCQVKTTLATQQKTYGGMGGIFMNYTIGLKSKSGDSIVIDSLKTIADPTLLHCSYNKTEKNYCELTFSMALAAPSKCRTCPDVIPPHYNFTKGMVVYYSQGKKRSSVKVKKFKQLPDLRLP